MKRIKFPEKTGSLKRVEKNKGKELKFSSV